MGQPQFMPSSYLSYAVDFDGDGRRDIWTSHADTLASISSTRTTTRCCTTTARYALAVGILAGRIGEGL